MRERDDFTDRLRDLAVAPPPRREHRERLRAELHGLHRSRRRFAPVLVAAVVVLAFGVTLLDEGVLESTGYRFHYAETLGDTVLVLAAHEDARGGIGYGESRNNRALTLTDAHLAEVQDRLELARMNYETGAAPLFRVWGAVFDGQENIELHYRTYFGDEFMDYPVATDKTIVDPRYYDYCRTDDYREFAADVALHRVAPGVVDTLYIDDRPVLMKRWRRVDPVYGEIELSEGYPLR